jgi:hypothetical protein
MADAMWYVEDAFSYGVRDLKGAYDKAAAEERNGKYYECSK